MSSRDVFLCHASEDKNAYVLPMERALTDVGVSCWIDAMGIGWGETIVRRINDGLATSKYMGAALLRRRGHG